MQIIESVLGPKRLFPFAGITIQETTCAMLTILFAPTTAYPSVIGLGTRLACKKIFR